MNVSLICDLDEKEYDPCISYTNCTGSDFVRNWTEHCCQPGSIRNIKVYILSVIGCVGAIGIICNTINFFTFIYLFCCKKRIKHKFGQDFSMITEDPVVFLILHLGLCDLLYCVIGLPSYWTFFYFGFFPYSERLCTILAFLRYTIGRFILVREAIKKKNYETSQIVKAPLTHPPPRLLCT